jgi:hypothetical protein
MKTRNLIVTMIGCMLVSGPAWAAEQAAPVSKPAQEAGPATNTKKKALEKGMSAEDVIAMIGKPDRVEPMKTEQGKAEIWTYRRKTDLMVTQVPTHTVDITTFNGRAYDGAGTVQTPQLAYGTETTTTYQVTSLLMFDGKLVVAKQWREREKTLSR